jgi:hypothetical protein
VPLKPGHYLGILSNQGLSKVLPRITLFLIFYWSMILFHGCRTPWSVGRFSGVFFMVKRAKRYHKKFGS